MKGSMSRLVPLAVETSTVAWPSQVMRVPCKDVIASPQNIRRKSGMIGMQKTGNPGEVGLACTARCSPPHDDFRDAVFGQELAVAGPAGKELFNAAVGKRALDGKLLPKLHLDV